MEESLGLGKKSYGNEADTETWSWFRLPIPKPGLCRTLQSRIFQGLVVLGYSSKISRIVSTVVFWFQQDFFLIVWFKQVFRIELNLF